MSDPAEPWLCRPNRRNSPRTHRLFDLLDSMESDGRAKRFPVLFEQLDHAYGQSRNDDEDRRYDDMRESEKDREDYEMDRQYDNEVGK